jgi:hypothetical protein
MIYYNARSPSNTKEGVKRNRSIRDLQVRLEPAANFEDKEGKKNAIKVRIIFNITYEATSLSGFNNWLFGISEE